MKEIFCVAVFVGKMLCLLVFVSALRPDSIGAVQASMRPAYCKIERSRTQGCGLNISAAASAVDVGTCSVRPTAGRC
jgi:hypothetical protein